MKKIITIIMATIITIFMGFEYDIINNQICYRQANSFLWFIVLAFVIIVWQEALKYKEKRLWKYSISISFLLASFAIIGNFAANYTNGELDQYTITFIFFLLAKWSVYFATILAIIVIGYQKIQNYIQNKEEKKIFRYFTHNKKSIIIVAVILLIAYIPYFLNYFPGNGMPDSVTEVKQAIGVEALSNHHPAMHILIVRLCFMIGSFLCHNYVAGYAIYMMLQILFVCFTFSYAIYYMAKKKVNLSYRIASLLFFMFCPILTLYNTTLLKDVPFALCVLWDTIFCIEMITNTEDFFQSKKKLVAFVFLLLGTMFFRNNGIYVVILSFPFILGVVRQCYKPIITIFVVSIAIYKIVTGPIYTTIGVIPGSSREALSIPLQQFARISKYKADFLTQEEKEKIYQYLPVENIGELYHPLSSDPVKDKFSEEGFEKDKFGIIKLYFKLAMKYPGQTLYSFINNSYGYYYPDTVGWGITYGINQVGFHHYSEKENFGLERKPIIKIKAIDKIHDFMNKKDIPLLSMLGSSGFYFWLMCIAAVFCMYSKKYKLCISYLPIFIVWLTCLASPVYCENRYIYSLYVGLPILISLPMMKDKE